MALPGFADRYRCSPAQTQPRVTHCEAVPPRDHATVTAPLLVSADGLRATLASRDNITGNAIATDPTGAERRRRSRERERLGIRLVTVPLGHEHCETLAAWGLVAAGEKNPERIAVAVKLLIDGLGAGVVDISIDALEAYLRAVVDEAA